MWHRGRSDDDAAVRMPTRTKVVSSKQGATGLLNPTSNG